jgi:hypothetical protein
MVQILLACPHDGCLAEGAAFTCHSAVPIRPGTPEYIVFMQCGVCGNGVIGRFNNPGIPNWLNGAAGDLRPVETWPKRIASAAPEHVPDNVKGFYLQAMDNYKRRNWDAAGAMFRKALDTSLRRLNPGGQGTIYERINGLPANIGLTDAMKEWAHQIRRLGADAAHDEDPFTEVEAQAVQAFTELFLTYAFMLPGMLAARNPAAPPAPA